MPTVAAENLNGSIVTQTIAKGYRGRVRTGCLTCRTRKVRCDESRPICNNCIRLQRACLYPAKKVKGISVINTQPQENTTSHALSGEGSMIETATPSQNWQAFPSNDGNCHTRRLLHGNASDITTKSAQDSFLFPDSAIVSFRQDDQGTPSHDNQPGEMSTATLISRDISLTTTMDKLTASSVGLPPCLTFFMEHVNCTPILSFDQINWRNLKQYVTTVAESDSVLASALIAFVILCKALCYGLHLTTAQKLYHNAKDEFEKSFETSPKLESFMITAFLLCLFEYQHLETTPMLQSPNPSFASHLTRFKAANSPCSAVTSRIALWLRLLHVSASRAGGIGIMSDQTYDILSEYVNLGLDITPYPNQQEDASINIFQVLSRPVFEFYYQLQMISGEIARLTHYCRSRNSGRDQEEVIEKLTEIRSRLRSLWETRSATQRQSPGDLRSHFSPRIVGLMLTLIGLCTAAYHAEFVEIDRVMGDPVSQSLESRGSRCAIREIIEGDWNAYDGGKLNPGFLRPLFLYAIECMDGEQTEWAVNRLKEINSRLYRNEFFADFAKALSDTQLRKDRRVASKYFCIWYFGEPPPHL